MAPHRRCGLGFRGARSGPYPAGSLSRLLCRVAASEQLRPADVLEVVEDDPELFATWVDEIEVRDKKRAEFEDWNNLHELLGVVGELVSVLRVEHLIANSKRGTKPPDVWRPRRPGQPDKPKGVSPREMALRMMRG